MNKVKQAVNEIDGRSYLYIKVPNWYGYAEELTVKIFAKCWVRNNQSHRDGDKPAIIYDNGAMIWCQNGTRHRDGDMPAVIHVDGTQFWYEANILHREDGPAIISPEGNLAWYKFGQPDIPSMIKL